MTYITEDCGKVKIRKLTPQAIIPSKAHPDAAAFDVTTPRDYLLRPGRNTISLEFAIDIPRWHEAKIEPRSGFSSKGIEAYELCNPNEPTRIDADVIVGKIDCGYHGAVGVIVNNRQGSEYLVKAGTRLAQLTVYELPQISGFKEVEEFDVETDRGAMGFGSSGTTIS